MNYFDSVDWNAVGSIGSAISALVAILVLWITARGLIEESKKSRESFRQSFLMNSANMITTFESTYYGDRGTKDRKRASTALLTIRNKNKDREFANSTDVFDLYDVGTENFSLFSTP